MKKGYPGGTQGGSEMLSPAHLHLSQSAHLPKSKQQAPRYLLPFPLPGDSSISLYTAGKVPQASHLCSFVHTMPATQTTPLPFTSVNSVVTV